MGWCGGRRRIGWCILGLGSILILILGSAVALARLDRERRQADPERVARLAHAELPPLAPVTVQAGAWPQWRGPNRDGVSPETGFLAAWPPEGPRVLWKQLVGRGFSSVVIAGGRLYTMEEDAGAADPPSRHEAVVCLDAGTGNVLWRFRYPCDFDERFGSGPRSTPAVDGEFVYTIGPTGILHCLRADTGEKVWRHDLLDEFHGRRPQYGVAFSPLVEGDLVYAMPGGPNGSAVAAFHKRTGALVWKALDDPVGYSSPLAVTAAGVRQILFFTDAALVSLAPEDGRLYWRYPWKTEGGFNIATPVAFGNYVFISSGYGKGCGLLEISADADGCLRACRVYEHNRMRNHFASSVRCCDYLYGFDMTDLACMDLRTGAIAWRENGARTFRKGSLMAADGRLLILGEDGNLALVEASPTGYHELASCSVSQSKCWTVPALAGGRLYVRDESVITCLDVRGSAAGTPLSPIPEVTPSR
jgi:outer membrane protein assembly factor BamB